MPSLRAPFSPNIHGFADLEALGTFSFCGFYGGFIAQPWLITSLTIGNWYHSLAPPHLPGGWEWGWKFQPSNPLIGYPGNQPPSLGASKSHLIHITKDTFISSHHSGNSKGFRSSVPETGTKTRYIFLIINHSITITNAPPGLTRPSSHWWCVALLSKISEWECNDFCDSKVQEWILVSGRDGSKHSN